ncbi:diaminohydroxyphosphoribosylaminopyrimidine deaminase [Putridiphycobacter roseus]|uniref:Diaminohydroxyphosphoribosylaminopyrimidine deaminase n=1 Tax=Putridiphycobacter roseus TaxID=2219161 RepID=A0A2W1N365_9FLAO|nr:NAD-dependent epimerase/dehydratase family protein [Putridiphycobacter roseus]PZE18000.1 diaminohydroxyphosphoribosylaminopyrimidine deaminase [Putridiphycobacter roseus]
MKHTILVTGGTGYIGSWVTKGLLENGHTVRLTVRDKSKPEKFAFLTEIANDSPGTLEIWEADLMKAGSFDAPAKGADLIAHLASPFILNVKDPQRDLIDPAVKGTENVLSAANHSGTVKKVVLTSSVAAIHGDNVDMENMGLEEFTEAQFNTSSSLNHQPYSYSKVMAEKRAWEIANAQSDWQLVVMNPAFVMGPSLTTQSKSESLKLVTDLLTGKFKSGAPELYFGFVDVRDIAKAHIYGLEHTAEGRHILSNQVASFLDMSKVISKKYGNTYKLPKSFAPKWLLSLIGGLFGVTRMFVKNNVGYHLKLNNNKSKTALKMEYIPFETTVIDMVEQMRAQKII